MKFTTKSLSAIKPSSDEVILWDEGNPGFGVRVSPSGRITFLLKYLIRGRRRTMSFGRFGDITLDQAEKMVKVARGQIAAGIDPQSGRDAAKQMQSLDVAWERFVEIKKPHWRESTLEGYKQLYARTIRPALGNRPVGDIDLASVTALHHKMRETPRAANLALAVLSSFINFARKQGMYPHPNPCEAVTRYKERPRERVLSDDEIARVGSAIDTLDNEHIQAAIRLILLLGCRKSEVLKMRWADVNLDAGIARLPETKTGARTVYLPDEAIEILHNLKRQNGYVIAGDVKGKHLVNLNKSWTKVTKAAGVENATIHDLRRTFGSRAVSNGADLYMVSKLLGHASVKMTEQAYAFMKDERKAEAAREVSRGIASVLNSRSGNVVKMAAHDEQG